MASVTDYFARFGAEEYQSSLFKLLRGYHVFKDIWDPYLGDGFTTKHNTSETTTTISTVVVLPVDCHSEIVPPWRMNWQHSLYISLGKCPSAYTLIVWVVSLVLCGEAVAHVRIPHVLVNVVVTYNKYLHSSSITNLARLCTCRSSSALIVQLGATPI